MQITVISFRELKQLLLARGVPAEAVNAASSKAMLRAAAERNPVCSLEFVT